MYTRQANRGYSGIDSQSPCENIYKLLEHNTHTGNRAPLSLTCQRLDGKQKYITSHATTNSLCSRCPRAIINHRLRQKAIHGIRVVCKSTSLGTLSSNQPGSPLRAQRERCYSTTFLTLTFRSPFMRLTRESLHSMSSGVVPVTVSSNWRNRCANVRYSSAYARLGTLMVSSQRCVQWSKDFIARIFFLEKKKKKQEYILHSQAIPRPSRKVEQLFLHFLRVVLQPALWPKVRRVFKNSLVVVIQIMAVTNNRLHECARSVGDHLTRERMKDCPYPRRNRPAGDDRPFRRDDSRKPTRYAIGNAKGLLDHSSLGWGMDVSRTLLMLAGDGLRTR